MNDQNELELAIQIERLESHIYATEFSGATRARARSTLARLDDLINSMEALPTRRLTGLAASAIITYMKRFRAECTSSEWGVLEDLLTIRECALHLPDANRPETYLSTPAGILLLDAGVK